MKNSDFWKNHWQDRSKLQDEISVSGWGSKQIKEYLNDLDDISKKLRLNKKDRLLNIGCANGLMELVLNYWVSKIDSIDFSEGMIKRAKRNNNKNKNVTFYVGNILNLSFLKSKYDKILCNSVIQYLNNLEEIVKSFEEIKKVCKQKVMVLVSANSDKSKLKEFLNGYDTLDLTKEEKQKKKEATKLSLWTDPKEVLSIAKKVGFKAKILKMNHNVWQSWYMYDLLIWRG